MLVKDLEDTRGPQYTAAPLLLSSLQTLLGLLELTYNLRTNIAPQYLTYWKAFDASIDTVYIIRVVQYRASRRERYQATLAVSEVVLYTVVSCVRYLYTGWALPPGSDGLLLVIIRTPLQHKSDLGFID